jgi:hypothetical protein
VGGTDGPSAHAVSVGDDISSLAHRSGHGVQPAAAESTDVLKDAHVRAVQTGDPPQLPEQTAPAGGVVGGADPGSLAGGGHVLARESAGEDAHAGGPPGPGESEGEPADACEEVNGVVSVKMLGAEVAHVGEEYVAGRE